MTTELNTRDNEERIQTIKACGQSLIDNAKSIVGDYKYLKDIVVTCYVGDPDTMPYINVSIDFYPEGTP